MSRILVGNVLMPERMDGAVVDLDGVVTRTARVHAAAWKQTFDEYLARRHPDQEAFDIGSDYPAYVDGKPRLDGIRSFLSSRGIELTEGATGDGPERDTVHGLGRRKNDLFRDNLEAVGVEVYDSSVAFLRTLRRHGIPIAVVSSSRNCAAVLEAAGIAGLFDARVDGRELERLGLAGKPAPDMFTEAMGRLAVDPQRVVGIEDATAGIEAARAAGIACVIGVDRHGDPGRLDAAGAHAVVSDLGEIRVAEPAADPVPATRLPCALQSFAGIVPADDDRRLAVFLDYDGTLTPIVSHPEDAVLRASARATLERLARICTVAILSGRDLDDVRDRVGIPSLWYAGSHGFHIEGPGGERMDLDEGVSRLPALDEAERGLRAALDGVSGCQVERKRFAIAVHYRRVADEDITTVRRAAECAHADHQGLRLTTGKMIFELQPDIDWHKGRALRWLMATLNLDPPDFLPVYVGDDETDEDAFAEIAPYGIGIVVAEADQLTRAAYRLDGPDQVEDLLGRIAGELEGR